MRHLTEKWKFLIPTNPPFRLVHFGFTHMDYFSVHLDRLLYSACVPVNNKWIIASHYFGMAQPVKFSQLVYKPRRQLWWISINQYLCQWKSYHRNIRPIILPHRLEIGVYSDHMILKFTTCLQTAFVNVCDSIALISKGVSFVPVLAMSTAMSETSTVVKCPSSYTAAVPYG